MIVSENGRYRVVKTEEEEEKALLKELESLLPEELEALQILLAESASPKQGGNLIDALGTAQFKHKPVDIETFVKDPYFLGETCDQIYPVLMEHLKNIFTGGYNEVVLTGCVDLGSLIVKENGEILDIRSAVRASPFKASVLGFPGKRVAFTRASQATHSGIKQTLRVEAANGMALYLTPEHKMMTQRGWVEAQNLVQDQDFLVSPRKITTQPDTDLSLDEAALIGYMTGNEDSDWYRGRFSARRVGVIRDFVSVSRGAGYEVVLEKFRNGAAEVFIQPAYCSYFSALVERQASFSAGSPERRTCPLVTRSSNAAVARYLQALFACEGTVCYSDAAVPQLQMGLNSECLVREVQLLLLRFGINSRLRRAGSFHKRKQEDYDWWLLTISEKTDLTLFLEHIGVLPGHEEDCERLEHRLTYMSSSTDSDSVPEELRGLSVDSNLQFERLRSVTEAGEREVGDLSVSDGTAFSCNGLISHNSIGYGKSFLASIGVCRVIYELSCLKDPQKAYGLAADSKISAICLSVTEQLAIKVAFEYVAGKLKASEYFNKHFPFKAMKKELVFPNNVWVAARATTDTSALGLAPISSFLDETNFLAKPVKSVRHVPGTPVYDQAETIYNAIKRRMKSRFEKRGRLPGVLFLVSSKQSTEDFTERRIRESKNDPSVYVVDLALWEAKPEAYDMTKVFHVFCGNEAAFSKILEPSEVESVKADLPEGTVVLEVPEEFRADFERDIEGSIRDLGGLATAAIRPFVNRREKIMDAVDPHRQHPFSTEIWDMSKGGAPIWTMLSRKVTEREPGGGTREVVRPIINPTAARHVHIDPSLRGDCAGVAITHICGWKDVKRRSDDHREFLERAPIYFVDLILQVVPPLGGEITLGEIRRLVYDFSAHGFVITSVTTDSFQSADTIQTLAAKGYNASLLSVDTSIEPYDTLKLALYEDRLIMYLYDPLIKELRTLERNDAKGKVDHPPRGSKDVSDALAGTIFSLGRDNSHLPVPIGSTSTMTPSMWMDPGQAAAVGGTSPLIDTPASPGLTTLPPFFYGRGSDDWGDGWDPGSF